MRPLVTLAGAALAVCLAGPALADPPPPSVPDNPGADSAFLDSLNNAGMHYNSAPNAVAAGRMACSLMDQGLSQNELIRKLSLLNPGLNSGGAMKFAALASTAYCPDWLGKESGPPPTNSPSGGFGGRF